MEIEGMQGSLEHHCVAARGNNVCMIFEKISIKMNNYKKCWNRRKRGKKLVIAIVKYKAQQKKNIKILRNNFNINVWKARIGQTIKHGNERDKKRPERNFWYSAIKTKNKIIRDGKAVGAWVMLREVGRRCAVWPLASGGGTGAPSAPQSQGGQEETRQTRPGTLCCINMEQNFVPHSKQSNKIKTSLGKKENSPAHVESKPDTEWRKMQSEGKHSLVPDWVPGSGWPGSGGWSSWGCRPACSPWWRSAASPPGSASQTAGGWKTY